MKPERNRKLVGLALIVVGALFLLVSNHVLLGWEHIWPLFPLIGGLIFLRVFRSNRLPEMLFAGLSSALLGSFLLLFSAGIVPWDRMAVAWPTIPLIAGISLAAASTVGTRGGTSLIVGATVIVFSAALFLLESGAVNSRIAAPFVRFWPLLLIAAGAIMLRMGPKSPTREDPDMGAVREVLAAADDAIDSEGMIPPGLDATILDRVRQAGDSDEAVAALVHGLKANFAHFSWVGFYRASEDSLTLGDADFVGPATELRTISVDQGICGAAARERRAIVVPDVSVDDRYLARAAGVRSEAVFPAIDGATLIGVLDVDSEEPDGFTPADVSFLENLVQRAVPHLRLPAGTT